MKCLIFLILNQKVLEKIVQTVMHNDTDICSLQVLKLFLKYDFLALI